RSHASRPSGATTRTREATAPCGRTRSSMAPPSAASTPSLSSSCAMSPDARRAQVAAALVVAALLSGSAAAFAFAEHLKLERSPVFSTLVGKLLGPNCRCQYRGIRIQFTLRKPDRLSVVIVDSDDHVVRTLLMPTPVRAGRQRFGWDGRNDAGQVVPAGTYKPRLHLSNERR